jgi:HK97 family phage portal protein
MEDADFDQLGFSPSEMELLDLMQQAGREIAVAMGPAPELLGDPENKVYNNVSEARESLYTEHIIPLGRLVAGEMSSWLLPQFSGDGLRFSFDERDVTALQQDPEKQRETDLRELEAGAITINEYRERQGLEPVDGGDMLLIGTDRQPLSAPAE